MMKDEKTEILKLITFFSVLGRSLTAHDLWRLISPEKRPENFLALLHELEELESDGRVKIVSSLISISGIESENLESRAKTNKLLAEKWKLLLSHRHYFNCLPFIDFVLVAGSMAIGNVNKYSDFDVIIGCKKNRIFTARLFVVFIFHLLGRRRRKFHNREKGSDKFCFNHFVTPESYQLKNPDSLYWRILYLSLVPIYGNPETIVNFFKSNNWRGKQITVFDDRFLEKSYNEIRILLEFILSTPLGNLLEWFAKKIQYRILNETTKTISSNHSRFFADETELELHLNTKRILEIENNVKSVINY